MSSIDIFLISLVATIAIFGVVYPIIDECIYLIFGDDEED